MPIRPFAQGCSLIQSTGIDAVLALGGEGIEGSFGFEAAAGVLDDDGVAFAGGADGEGAGADAGRFVVGRPLEEDRGAAGCRGPVDVGVEDGAVAHGHGDVAFEGDGELLGHREALHLGEGGRTVGCCGVIFSQVGGAWVSRERAGTMRPTHRRGGSPCPPWFECHDGALWRTGDIGRVSTGETSRTSDQGGHGDPPLRSV